MFGGGGGGRRVPGVTWALLDPDPDVDLSAPRYSLDNGYSLQPGLPCDMLHNTVGRQKSGQSIIRIRLERKNYMLLTKTNGVTIRKQAIR